MAGVYSSLIYTVGLALCAMAHGAAGSVGTFGDSPRYALPSVEYSDLVVLDDTAVLQLALDLTSLGAVQVRNIPGFAAARGAALSGLAACLAADGEAVAVAMNDGSRRLTTAAASVAGEPSAMGGACGQKADPLRSSTDAAARQLLLALDKAVSLQQRSGSSEMSTDGVLDGKYNSFAKIHSSGEHLEHLHAFLKPPAPAEDSQDRAAESDPRLFVGDIGSTELTLPMHTDGGLFIAMTSGYYNDPNGQKIAVENGLYITLATGAVVKAVADDDSLIFMVGQGGADWLKPKLGQPLRAVPHAMVADVASTVGSKASSRAWFGKMYLPPADARAAAWGGRSYGEYRELLRSATAAAVQGNEKFVTTLPSACGSSAKTTGLLKGHSAERTSSVEENAYTSSFKPLVSNTLCNDGKGVMCWQNCYYGDDLPACGTAAECIDPVTGEPVDGTEMCMSEEGMNACYLGCPHQNHTDDGFCYGVGTSMFMTGFVSVSSEDEGSTACVNLFFDTWTLDSKTKYTVGCLGIFFLAIFFEYLKVMKRQLMGLWFLKTAPVYVKDAVSVLFYGAQLTISYFLMLAAMTYSTELFSSMIAGLTVGYALFTLKNKSKDSSPTCHDTGADDETDDTTQYASVVKSSDMPACCSGGDDDIEGSATEQPLYDTLISRKKTPSSGHKTG